MENCSNLLTNILLCKTCFVLNTVTNDSCLCKINTISIPVEIACIEIQLRLQHKVFNCLSNQ